MINKILKKVFSYNSYYIGSKKYKIFKICGIKIKKQVKISKNTKLFIKNSKPMPLNNDIEPPRKKVYLSIVAIFKDEPDIIEWIEYHKLAGVERFYLYDNDSRTDYTKILSEYIKSGDVIYKKIFGQCMQKPAYKDAIYRYKNETEWLAIIDLDEYIVPVEVNDIKDILKEFDNQCGVVINWLMFDSNGIIKRPKNKTTLEAYTRIHKNTKEDINRTIKTIVKPSKVRYINSVHACMYKNNELAVDENLNPVQSSLVFKTLNVSINKIRINHYHCKSKEDYINKINKGFADRKRNRTYDETQLNFKETSNDHTILKYNNKLKERLYEKTLL